MIWTGACSMPFGMPGTEAVISPTPGFHDQTGESRARTLRPFALSLAGILFVTMALGAVIASVVGVALPIRLAAMAVAFVIVAAGGTWFLSGQMVKSIGGMVEALGERTAQIRSSTALVVRDADVLASGTSA